MPLAQQYVSTNKNIALGVAAGGIFLLTLLVAYFVTAKLSDMILDSRIGALDRTLGFVFGAGRGLLLAVVAFLFFNWLVTDRQQPNWVKEAKLRPLLEQTGSALLALLPEDPEKLLRDRLQRRQDGDTPRDAPPGQEPQRRSDGPGGQPAQTPADHAALQRLIDTTPQGQRPQPAPAR
jgi:membrane protein required for colicin V production